MRRGCLFRSIQGWDLEHLAELGRTLKRRLHPRQWLLLVALPLLLCPIAAGTHTALRVPVLYRRVELKSREPVMLELGLPRAEFQIEPASLGYFVDKPGGPLQFVYSGDVARGLIFAQLPPTPPGKDAAAAGTPGPGSVVVLELSAPGGEEFYQDELKTIRSNVTELNRRRNLLRLAQNGAQGSYRKSLDALWKALDVTSAGLNSGGWLDRVLSNGAADVPQLASAVETDARQRCDQKGLFYSAEQARLKLLLSQFDLQLDLARLPHQRSAELLSLGDDKAVRATTLAEIDRIGGTWKTLLDDLQRRVGVGQAQLDRLTASADPAAPPSAASLAASMDPRSLVVVPPGSGTAVSAASPRQALERAVVSAWLSVQQRELNELQASEPQLEAARKHVASSDAVDWASRPQIAVALATFHTPTLENLKYYPALEAGVDPATASGLLGGLAQEFATPLPSGPGLLSDIFNPAQQRREVLDGLSAGKLAVAPDELSYGLLALERCAPVSPEAMRVDDPPTAASAAPAPSFRLGGGGDAVRPISATATPVKLSAPPEEHGTEDIALRAQLVGQLDLVLRNPDSRGLAAYDLAYLKFMRWYAALSLPATAAAPATGGSAPKLDTQSYGFKAASHDP